MAVERCRVVCLVLPLRRHHCHAWCGVPSATHPLQGIFTSAILSAPLLLVMFVILVRRLATAVAFGFAAVAAGAALCPAPPMLQRVAPRACTCSQCPSMSVRFPPSPWQVYYLVSTCVLLVRMKRKEIEWKLRQRRRAGAALAFCVHVHAHALRGRQAGRRTWVQYADGSGLSRGLMQSCLPPCLQRLWRRERAAPSSSVAGSSRARRRRRSNEPADKLPTGAQLAVCKESVATKSRQEGERGSPRTATAHARGAGQRYASTAS